MSEKTAREYRYKTTFTSLARVAEATEDEKFVAKASLEPLKKLLPADLNPADAPDLLFISSDGAVAGVANLNGDGLSCATAIAIHRTARYKYISTDHERDKVVGVVLFPSLTHRDTHEPLTDEQAAALGNTPFNMSFAGAVWKVIQPLLAKFLRQTGGAQTPDALSMSWEIAFDDYAIAVGSTNFGEARIVNTSDADFKALDKCLYGNGGNGKTKDGQSVSRMITGEAIILGYSIVGNPAAAVKGILPVVTESNTATDTPAAAMTKDQGPMTNESNLAEAFEALRKNDSEFTKTIKALTEALESAAKNQNTQVAATASEQKIINTEKTRVTGNTTIPMKIESLKQIEDKWAEIRQLETCASVVDFVKAIQDGSTQYEQKLKDEQTLAQQMKSNAEAAEKRAKELETTLAGVQQQLTELQASQVELERNQKFQERMASFDEQYDLDDEDRQLIASDIKELSDESFASYQKKFAKLAASKKKKAEFPPKKDDKKSDPCDDKKKEMEEEEAKKAKAAIASLTEKPGQTSLPNGATAETTLKDDMFAAFGESFKIGGKSVKQIAAEKAAKAAQQE